MTSPAVKPGRVWLLLLVVSALWGSSYMFIKVALEEVAPSFIVVARVALGALVLIPLALRRGALTDAGSYLAPLAVVSAIQIVGPFLLIAVAEQTIASSLAGILLASGPIFTVLIAAAFLPEETLRGWALLGILVGIAGVVVLLGADVGGDGVVVGGLVVLLACLGYAAGPLVAKRRLAGLPPLGVAAGIIGLATVMCLPLLPLATPDSWPSAKVVGALVGLGAGGTGAAFLLYFVLVAQIGPSRASVVGYIVPGFSVLYGIVLLSEPFTAFTASGLGLILLGSGLAARAPSPLPRSAATS